MKAGKPSRLALSANAWGESVPTNEAAAHKLAAKGRALESVSRGTKQTFTTVKFGRRRELLALPETASHLL